MTPQRIVFAGEFWEGSSCKGLADGLRKLGHSVDQVEIYDVFPQRRDVIGRVWSRLNRSRDIGRFRQRIMTRVAAEKADLLVTLKGSYLTPEFLSGLRARGTRSINFYPDYLIRHGDFRPEWAAGYDQFITTKSFQLEWLQSLLPADRIGYVPHGYSPSVHRPDAVPESDDGFRWDIAYVGNASPSKIAWMAELLDRLPDARALIVGNRWDTFSRPNCDCVGPLMGHDYAAAIARSRINVAIHAGRDPATGWEDLVSTRSFEIPASGGFMLHIDNPEIRGFYEPRREIDVFSTADELAAKVRHYLDHPDQRMAVAAAGRARATPAYSYDARAAELMALVGPRLGLKA